ncbi:MAG: DUF1788 domain-containing protein [Atopobium sp.]|jgi:hypothetical protein|nr:DUF1788 domain-containing protein [Atopobium sp.]RRF98311.1 MAG: DUF1788 domain-containing protein [Coriobacteriaceae bacterium]
MGAVFNHINDARQFIVDKLSDDALLGRNGYMMREGTYIIDYDPSQQAYAADLIHVICEHDLPDRGVTPIEVNLYDLVLQRLDNDGVWERIVQAEAVVERSDLIRMLEGAADAKGYLASKVIEAIEAHGDADIAFVTGIGETFPYVRTGNLLSGLSPKIPIVLVFPGSYEHFADGTTSVNILGLKQNLGSGYYRATRVFDL